MQAKPSTALINLALLGGAALALAACDTAAKKAATQTSLKALDMTQQGKNGSCIYKALKADPALKIGTKPGVSTVEYVTTIVTVDGTEVATIKAPAVGEATTTPDKLDEKSPLTPTMLQAAKGAAPKCRSDALNNG